MDPVKLEQEVEQLAKLSASIRVPIEQLNQGTLPKDLLDRLGQVEKMAKHLWSEITR